MWFGFRFLIIKISILFCYIRLVNIDVKSCLINKKGFGLMKKSSKFSIILIIIVLIVGIFFGIYKHKATLSNKQFDALPVREQFKQAPKGHYIHLLKNDSNLYRTTWTKKQIQDAILKISETDTNRDGTTNYQTNLGTNHEFKDSVSVNSESSNGFLTNVFTKIINNSKFNNVSPKDYRDYNWYFDSPKDAQKDANVLMYVTHITR